MEINELRKRFGVSNGWIADKMGYSNVHSYNNSKGKERIENLLCCFVDIVESVKNRTPEGVGRLSKREKARISKEEKAWKLSELKKMLDGLDAHYGKISKKSDPSGSTQ